jgi:hypothetical protein
MKAAVLSLALALDLSAQSPVERLKSDVQVLRERSAATPAMMRQVSGHISLLAEKTHEPKAPTLQQFTNNLVYALAGHPLTPEESGGLCADIEHVMQSAGTSTRIFSDTVEDFEKRLTAAGVPATRAHDVASDLERVGKEVRGPEDTPVKP